MTKFEKLMLVENPFCPIDGQFMERTKGGSWQCPFCGSTDTDQSMKCSFIDERRKTKHQLPACDAPAQHKYFDRGLGVSGAHLGFCAYHWKKTGMDKVKSVVTGWLVERCRRHEEKWTIRTRGVFSYKRKWRISYSYLNRNRLVGYVPAKRYATRDDAERAMVNFVFKEPQYIGELKIVRDKTLVRLGKKTRTNPVLSWGDGV